MAKIHLNISPQPFTSGHDTVAFCGDLVPKAQGLPLITNEGLDSESSIIFCRDCFGPRYTSFIVSGQEYLDDERLKFALKSPKPKPRQTDFPIPDSTSEAA